MPAAHTTHGHGGHVPGERLPGGTRERLVAAASELLAEGGVAAVTLRSVGERAGVSRTAPYRHFQDKDDLLAAVALQTFQQLYADMIAAITTAPASVPEALRRGFRSYVRSGLARPEHYRLIFHDPWADGPEATTKATEPLPEAFHYFATLLAEGQRAGEIRNGNPENMTFLTWSALHGLVILAQSGHLARKGIASEEALARLIDELVAGLEA